ncbi:hypothetical protein [Nonomuraea sp. SBT364]|uniref:hypothetical protein n=1 Tax=Nonomuraea sp. SBT364 TaxID=1580530 RepID=UPI00066B251E|nr:hypothetical protein [Nonomuraea sp. SBT364]
MRKQPRDAAAPLLKFADVPGSQQPGPAPLHGAELRRPPSDHGIRASKQVRSVRIVARRRSY